MTWRTVFVLWMLGDGESKDTEFGKGTELHDLHVLHAGEMQKRPQKRGDYLKWSPGLGPLMTLANVIENPGRVLTYVLTSGC